MLIVAYQYRHVELPALRSLRCVHRPRMMRDDWRPVGVTLIESTSPHFDEVRQAFAKEEDVTWWLDEVCRSPFVSAVGV